MKTLLVRRRSRNSDRWDRFFFLCLTVTIGSYYLMQTQLITVDSEVFADLYFTNLSLPNISRFLEFASDYLNNLNIYLKLGVFNNSENFEFVRQQIRQY